MVDEHHREPSAHEPAERGRVRVAGVDQRTVDGHVASGHAAVRGRCAQQSEGTSARSELVGDSGEEGHRHVVGEGVGEGVRQHDTDGARCSADQGAGCWVRATVAEFVGYTQDPLAQLRGELLGVGERVGDRHPAHADVIGDGLQGYSPHGAARLSLGPRQPRTREPSAGPEGATTSPSRCNTDAVTLRARRARGAVSTCGTTGALGSALNASRFSRSKALSPSDR